MLPGRGVQIISETRTPNTEVLLGAVLDKGLGDRSSGRLPMLEKDGAKAGQAGG